MSAPVYGIIGAMAEEVAELLELLQETEELRRGPFVVHRGRLGGKRVLVARCGIGKVNAAALTQLLISEGAGRVLFTGVAGAVDPTLEVGDLVVGEDAVQHDLEVTALGYAPGEVPGDGSAWRADPALVDAAFAAASEVAAEAGVRALKGRVASGDQFIADPARVAWLRDAFGAACAEMEGAAVAQVCAKWGVPFVIVRSISDTADHSASVDFRAFTPLAAARAKRVLRGTLERL